MHVRLAIAIFALQCCEICVPIKVPVTWDSDDSKVQPNDEFSVDQFKPVAYNTQQPVPVEYFEYTAKKPQFAVDIAEFHGVPSPQNHYKSYPVLPYTDKKKPELGKHRLQDPNRPVFHEFQQYINQNQPLVSIEKPVSTEYDVFHPYKAEEPGLKELYKDPFLDKIRSDIRDSGQRLQNYEIEAGKANINKDEYLESLDQTDFKKTPEKNIPAPYEIHRPQRRPVYYRPVPRPPNRDHILNQRFQHPWHQNFYKIRPMSYRPLKKHLNKLRQHHALTYGDDLNEYPQLNPPQGYEKPSDGYDIFEKGKEKYIGLRNNLDNSVNNLVLRNRPAISQNLELQSDDSLENDEEQEFVPVKNYAQVRKIEITRHVPKQAAFDEAESYEEIKNAPRLKEAIKSTKAQTVYTEEGYEDTAYDHAGEQKHASDHEAHAGLLKEKELSGGKYTIPSESGSYDDSGGLEYKDKILDGKKWDDDKKSTYQNNDSEKYTSDEGDYSEKLEDYEENPTGNEEIQRNKRQGNVTYESDYDYEEKAISQSSQSILKKNNTNDDSENLSIQHDVNKREVAFKVPEINLNTTQLNEKDILEIAKESLITTNNLTEKYPYFFNNFTNISKHSPLRYAQDLKSIPKKTHGGTEFYDSRSGLECSEVDDKVNVLPKKFEKKGHPDEPDESDDKNKDNSSDDSGEQKSRLSGLGDKIDCFKAKYFGNNPLDSPFFKEETIKNPEPFVIPNIFTFALKKPKTVLNLESASSNIEKLNEKLRSDSIRNTDSFFDDLKNSQDMLKRSLAIDYPLLQNKLISDSAQTSNSTLNQPSTKFPDVVNNFNDFVNNSKSIQDTNKTLNFHDVNLNTPHKSQLGKDIVNSSETPDNARQKRSAIFQYEPYKIIKDGQITESKKTTTSNNISPLIKQLQSSKVIDVVVNSKNENEQPLKRNVRLKNYKNIGKNERKTSLDPDFADSNTTFVNVNTDSRRGEPRYELRPINHKLKYSPVENKKSISLKDYESQTTLQTNRRLPSPLSLYNIKNSFKESDELQSFAASNDIKSTVATTLAPDTLEKTKTDPKTETESNEDESKEYDDDYEEDDDEDDVDKDKEQVLTTTSSTTTTTTYKPMFKIRGRNTKTQIKEKENEEVPKLHFATRFRNAPSDKSHIKTNKQSESKPRAKTNYDDSPTQYKEKKKKSTNSTLVTDTKSYGGGEEDMRNAEIDALIGVQHDMNDYIPQYEKDAQKNIKEDESGSDEDGLKDESYEDDSAESGDIEEEEEEDDDEEDDDVEEIDDMDEVDEDYEEDNADKKIFKSKAEKNTVTTEIFPNRIPTTTYVPPITDKTQHLKQHINTPIVSKRRIEIHKELPVNKSSPHFTQFKQDIEEVEITKEVPVKKKPKNDNKHSEALDLYKDDNLAAEINKLGDVEVFSHNFDLKNSPKHGGNYKRAPDLETRDSPEALQNANNKNHDAETSNSENKKTIEIDDDSKSIALHGGNLKALSDIDNKSSKELTKNVRNPKRNQYNAGTQKSIENRRTPRRGSKRFQKKLELNEKLNDHVSETTTSKPQNSRLHIRGKHTQSGSYRNTKPAVPDVENKDTKEDVEAIKVKKPKDVTLHSAELLNSFAQAVPVLTTTPSYILDPSKRMYYYVD